MSGDQTFSIGQRVEIDITMIRSDIEQFEQYSGKRGTVVDFDGTMVIVQIDRGRQVAFPPELLISL